MGDVCSLSVCTHWELGIAYGWLHIVFVCSEEAVHGGLCMFSGVTTGKCVHTEKELHIVDSDCAQQLHTVGPAMLSGLRICTE